MILKYLHLALSTLKIQARIVLEFENIWERPFNHKLTNETGFRLLNIIWIDHLFIQLPHIERQS